MPVIHEYPRMLYKADAAKTEAQGFLQSNRRIGYITVRSSAEENREKKNGWVRYQSQAEEQLEKADRYRKFLSSAISAWKYWLPIIIAVIGLYFRYLGK